MSTDYRQTPTGDLISTCAAIFDEIARRHSLLADLNAIVHIAAASGIAKKPVDISRSSDDWVSLLMLSETQLELQTFYGYCDVVSLSLIEFFFIEKNDFLPGDKHVESHGSHADGSQRMEPRWRRQLIKALRNGQAVPGFPLQKVKGTKDKFKLVVVKP